jgi:hypothetical protein
MFENVTWGFGVWALVGILLSAVMLTVTSRLFRSKERRFGVALLVAGGSVFVYAFAAAAVAIVKAALGTIVSLFAFVLVAIIYIAVVCWFVKKAFKVGWLRAFLMFLIWMLLSFGVSVLVWLFFIVFFVGTKLAGGSGILIR